MRVTEYNLIVSFFSGNWTYFSCILQVFLSREDCNPDITGKASQTPLHIAAKMEKVSICKVLVSGKLGTIVGLLYKYLPKISIASCSLRKQVSHILQRHHWFPWEVTSEGYFTTQIWVVLLTGHSKKEICLSKSEALPIFGQWPVCQTEFLHSFLRTRWRCVISAAF